MEKAIIWKRRASQQILEIEGYLLENFSPNEVYRFLDKLYRKLEMLQKYPEIGQRTRFKSIRRLRIGRRVSLFYRV
ncbi:MAG: type II toxin-antitoxin system RelE/ParE family toxin [Phaeodactylibacter sp.]|nr:type II toxin-antitoxin system RelE/ParE family toxin [Phaeodactylibacter sp.]MCB9276535.1 type II toxin-antitoxin system RelE/ParE family toxin [Lewinellaceae bacterium]